MSSTRFPPVEYIHDQCLLQIARSVYVEANDRYVAIHEYECGSTLIRARRFTKPETSLALSPKAYAMLKDAMAILEHDPDLISATFGVREEFFEGDWEVRHD